MKMRLIILICLIAWVTFAYAQTNKIQIINANTFELAERQGGKVKKLIGQVQLKQDQTILYCDSAYLFDAINFVEAYGNVRINHSDSVNFYGDVLRYDGNKRLAKLQKNVSMVDPSSTLTTNELEFDLKQNRANYNSGGKLVSGVNVLTSKSGYYYTATRELFFKNVVELTNPEFNLKGDTLKYNTSNKTATFLGKTIISSDGDTIYCKAGTYQTEQQYGVLLKRAVVRSKENSITADTIFFNRKTNYIKAIGNILMHDTINKSFLLGNMAEVFGKQKNSYITNQALLISLMDKDTLFIWADSILTKQATVLQTKDVVKAYKNVKIFKQDLQAVCDSLVYIKQDSSIYLYKSPILWSDVNQITGDTIIFFINSKKLDSMDVRNNAFVISKETSKHYNQVKGKNLQAFFEQGKISFIHVFGNGQSIYYAKEDSSYLGVNIIDCSEMKFSFKMGKIASTKFITEPDATFYPIDELKPEELKIKGFKWLETLKPVRKKISNKKLNISL